MRQTEETDGLGARRRGSARAWLACVASIALYAALQLGSLGRPLFWQDEGETAMFGRRVLAHGVPRVHGAEGIVYGIGVPLEVAVERERDLYRGSLWGQYYVAALGVAAADRVDDAYAKTLRVRLPFVLTGMAGLALLAFAVRRELAGVYGAAPLGVAAFALLLAASTSLQLHLREARYYGLVVGLVGLAFALERARARRLAAGGAAVALGAALTLVLVALVGTFFPAAAGVGAWAVGEALLNARRGRRAGAGDASAASRRAARGLAPLALAPSPLALLPLVLAALAAAPILVWFDVRAVSDVLAERWQFGPAAYLANLGHLLVFLLRYEWLALLLVAEAALGYAHARGARAPETEPARDAAIAVLRLAFALALAGALNPIFFERYFVAVGPLLALAFVLDAGVLAARIDAKPASPERARVARALSGVLALALLASVAMRAGELAGRVREIASPPAGPVDAAVAWLAREFARPERLVIATNYEAEPLMFYLGSRVIGRFDEDAGSHAADAPSGPDVVIPRSGQPRRLAEVRYALLGGGYAPQRLDVADTPWNAIPELYEGRVLARTHWFESVRPGEPDPPLVVYVRRPGDRAPAAGTAESPAAGAAE